MNDLFPPEEIQAQAINEWLTKMKEQYPEWEPYNPLTPRLFQRRWTRGEWKPDPPVPNDEYLVEFQRRYPHWKEGISVQVKPAGCGCKGK